jgi:hypothetical protein
VLLTIPLILCFGVRKSAASDLPSTTGCYPLRYWNSDSRRTYSPVLELEDASAFVFLRPRTLLLLRNGIQDVAASDLLSAVD